MFELKFQSFGLGQWMHHPFRRLGGLVALIGLSLGAAVSAEPFRLQTPQGVIEVTALRPDIVRVRLGKATLPVDESFSVSPERRHATSPLTVSHDGNLVVLTTAALVVRLDPQTLKMTVLDSSGSTLLADADDADVAFRGQGFELRKHIPADAHYFGLGDKTGGLDRRGGSFTLWNTDAFLFQDYSDPLYKSVPFVLSADEKGHAFGFFLDNHWRTRFDFGRSERDTWVIGAEGGPVDYYIMAGPDPKAVVSAYGYLTGTPPLAPRWALGFQQSRWSYPTEAEARAVAGRLRSEHIPTDVLYLDIDYQDRNRPFTVDKAAFPDLAKLVHDLKADHIQLVLITDLHIAAPNDPAYLPFTSGKAIDAYLKDGAGNDYVGAVWPGPSVFPDFSVKSVRTWWGSLYADFVRMGVAGFWNDMNEPAIFLTDTKTMPLSVVHRIEDAGFSPRKATHLEMHNLVGMLNSQATFEGLLKLEPDQRPFVLTRASFAGGQKYAATWTGDNSSSFAQLNLATSQLTNLGLSGFAYVGDDIGGFAGAVPSPDLLTRWIEIGAFNPIFRDHSQKGKARQEPWVGPPEHLAIRRHYIEERYRLMPYIYHLAEENSRTGLPLMRPVFLEYPQTLGRLAGGGQPDFGLGGPFLFGPDLLVAPSATPESPGAYQVVLPSPGWYDYWTGERLAGVSVTEVPRLDRLPVFVRPGAILVKQPLTQSLTETPQGPLEVHVYPGPDCHGELYWDDGVSYGFQRGAFLRQDFTCKSDATGLSVDLGARRGAYVPWWKTVQVIVHGKVAGGVKITVNGRAAPARFDDASQAWRIDLAGDAVGPTEIKLMATAP